MAWYYGTYSCGHEGRVNIIGPTKDRQRKSDWHFSGLCPECYKKQLEEERAAANKEAEEKSAEMELPELNGTEKQVAWSNTLRVAFLEKAEKMLGDAQKAVKKGLVLRRISEESIPAKMETLYNSLYFGLKTKTDAKFWIDTRSYNVEEILCEFVVAYKNHKSTEIPEEVKREINEKKEESTIIPEAEERKPGVAEIEFDSAKSILTAEYQKDDDFIKIVKSLGFKWNGFVWHKEITEYTGDAEDRIAELGNKLLNTGFTVQFPNMESKEKAVSANFSLENDRWIKYSPKTGKFFITWKGTNNTLYAAAKKLPSAKWTSGSMDVNIEFYREVQDFAGTMGFSISQKAQLEIEKYKKKESGFELAKISEHTGEIISDEKRLEKSLKSGGTILEDLKDD